ncbi:MAG TPA: DNA mismatch repair endonuclease MutL [Verrucomicrobiae bacterium]|nr:DNA mismatch repair endonuclease MutL [Verrucomicrobiae bacterium]
MNRIRLLPEQVANQIAAGEVVERPASVVKELVENALDAQARRVSVEIQAGGRSLIRVTDDGLGMSRDDALLCLERHATSKIQRAEDLAAIRTMGFRGEAIPSIASVSRFILTTRERASDSPEGTQIILSGGKILEVKAAGTAPGTAVEVRQLFFNLPARRKFLRSEETEAAHILHYLTLAALAYPEAAFNFQKDGRAVWQLPAVKTGTDTPARLAALRERLQAFYGSDPKLLPVNFSQEMDGHSPNTEAEGESSKTETAAATVQHPFDGPSSADPSLFRLWGFLGAPGVSRATREDQHLFVNRRPIENRGLNFALLEGYHTALMKGRYPVCCLFLEIDPAAVEVNIHPSKREVKFHRESEVRRLVAHAVRQTLLQFHQKDSPASQARSQPESLHRAPTASPDLPAPTSGIAVAQASLPHLPHAPRAPLAAAPPSRQAQRPLPMGFRPQPAPAPASAPAPPASAQLPAAQPAPAQTASPLAAVTSTPPAPDTVARPHASTPPLPLLSVPLRLVGVIGKLYVVLESDRGLVLLDQHAAHERILFEQMLTRLEQNSQAPSQRLLLPETIELSAHDANFVRGQLSVLTRLGVGLSEFGERTFLLDALPPFVKASQPRRFVLELVDELKATGQEVNSLRLGEQMVAKTVCRHAVKANDPLRGAELEKLVEDLRHCAMPYTCPHGRPTLIEMNFRELEKKFGRTQ